MKQERICWGKNLNTNFSNNISVTQLASNQSPKLDDSGMPEKKYASTNGAILIMIYIVFVSVFLLYVIVQLWPSTTTASTPPATSPVTLFFWTFSIADEARLLLIVAIAGSLGSLLHALRSVYWYFGNRELVTSWYAKYFLLPFAGAIIGLLTYFLIRGSFPGSPCSLILRKLYPLGTRDTSRNT